MQIILKGFHVLLHKTDTDIILALALTDMALHEMLPLLLLQLLHQFLQLAKLVHQFELSTLLQLPLLFSEQQSQQMIVLLETVILASEELINLQ